MIAYVFFHELAPGGDLAGYEDALRRFHAVLTEARVPGFAGSRTFRVGERYADWYLVDGSAALDPLNEAAVSGRRSSPHADVASQATNTAGKLLQLAAGAYDPDATVEVRFSKPRGMGYQELYARLEQTTKGAGTSLWRRMMVLGPPPEFCLIAPSGVTLPAEFDPQVFRREPV